MDNSIPPQTQNVELATSRQRVLDIMSERKVELDKDASKATEFVKLLNVHGRVFNRVFATGSPLPPLVHARPSSFSEPPEFNGAITVERRNEQESKSGAAIRDDVVALRSAMKRRDSATRDQFSSDSAEMRKMFWMSDKTATSCYECEILFSTFRRRHHCRMCGQVFCAKCSHYSASGESFGHNGVVRVCFNCYSILLDHASRAKGRKSTGATLPSIVPLDDWEDVDDRVVGESADGSRVKSDDGSPQKSNASASEVKETLRTVVSRRIADLPEVEDLWNDGDSPHRRSISQTMRGHLSFIIRRCLSFEGLGEEWAEPVLRLVSSAVAHVKTKDQRINILDYVKVKCIPCGEMEESAYVNGAMITKTLAHRKMKTFIKRPRILFIGFPLEYVRGDQKKLISLESVLLQEREYLQMMTARLIALEPTLVVLQNTAARLALEFLFEAGIGVVTNVKPEIMSRLSAITGGSVLQSIEETVAIKMGSMTFGMCEEFHVQTFTVSPDSAADQNDIATSFAGTALPYEMKHIDEGSLRAVHQIQRGLGCVKRKTVMTFAGGDQKAGSTIVLRGRGEQELARVKHVVRCLVFCAYSLRLEHSFLDCCHATLVKPNDVQDNVQSPEEAAQAAAEAASKDETAMLLISSSPGVVFPKSEESTRPPNDSELLPRVDPIPAAGASDEATSMSTSPPQKSFSKTSSRPSFFEHECLIVLFSSQSVVTNHMCLPPDVKMVGFYQRTDLSLERYLQRTCFQKNVCSDQKCGRDVCDHRRAYTHGTGKVSIAVHDDPSRESVDEIMVWLARRRNEPTESGEQGTVAGATSQPFTAETPTDVCTEAIPLSAEAGSYSFGKFLEMLLYNDCLRCRVCGSSFRGCHSICFSYKIRVVSFSFDHIAKLTIQRPAVRLTFSSQLEADFKTLEIDKFTKTVTQLYAAVLAKLRQLETTDVDTPETKSKIQLFYQQHRKERDFFLRQLEMIQISEFEMFELNKMRRRLFTNTLGWSSIFNKMILQQVKRRRKRRGLSDSMLPLSETDDDPFMEEASQMVVPQFLVQRLQGHHERAPVILPWNDDVGVVQTPLPATRESRVVSTSSASGEMAVDEEGTVSVSTGADLVARPGIAHGSLRRSVNDAFGFSMACDRGPLPLVAGSVWFDGNEIASGSENLRDRAPFVVHVCQSPTYEWGIGPVVGIEEGVVSEADWSFLNRKMPKSSSSSSSSPVQLPLIDSDIGRVGEAGESAALPESAGKSVKRWQDVTLSSSLMGAVVNLVANIAGNHDALRELTTMMKDDQGFLFLPDGKNGEIVVVYEDEPSSVVSHALCSVQYDQELTKQKKLIESSFDDGSGWTEDKKVEQVVKYPTAETSIVISEQATPPTKTGQKPSIRCVVYCASQFSALRSRYVLDDNDKQYIQSLSRCKKWAAEGGKSKASFNRTMDERFVLKRISNGELEQFLKYADAFFAHAASILFGALPSVLVKVLGLYKVTVSGKEQNIMVMENLFFDRRVQRTYDLKGSERSRYQRVSGKEKDAVLWDENLLELIDNNPLLLYEQARAALSMCVWNDTLFLTRQNVVDYSLLVGFDEDLNQLVVGIIDYLRPYRTREQLESWMKSTGLMGGKGKIPTVISPREYKSRFRQAMNRYFVFVPDKVRATLKSAHSLVQFTGGAGFHNQ